MNPSIDDTTSIILNDVSVRYRAPSQRYNTFKEYMISWLQGKVHHESFWALRGISFRIDQGEVVGIIGQNGAGKSTLLKLIARVLRPSTGYVVVCGRVAPLLELGAGFHPELSGRENVFLNGAMLGFNQKEMELKIQHIIDFSELAEFIDAPVRTYSSGMWARLGFAVATDVEPDVLILDEVLSVGDESFQAKCLNRIRKFRENQTTILLVSHNLGMVEEMCKRTIWLDHGKLMMDGNSKDVVKAYREHQANRSQ